MAQPSSKNVAGDRRQLPQTKKKSKADEGIVAIPESWKEKFAALGDVGSFAPLITALFNATTIRVQQSSIRQIGMQKNKFSNRCYSWKQKASHFEAFIVGLFTDLFFIDARGLLQAFLIYPLRSLRRLYPELNRILAERLAALVEHATKAASSTDAAEFDLTLKFVCEEAELFAELLVPHFISVVRFLFVRLRALVAVFGGADDVNTSTAALHSELLLKGCYGLFSCCSSSLRALCAPLVTAKSLEELPEDTKLIASLWQVLLRFALCKHAAVNLAAAGMTFAQIFLAPLSIAQASHHLLCFFFPQYLPASVSPVITFEPSVFLQLSSPFADFCAQLPPLARTFLLRGFVISSHGGVMLTPVDGKAILLLHAFFPAACALCESSTACDQTTRMLVFQSLAIVCHELDVAADGPHADDPSKLPPSISETMHVTPEEFYEILGKALQLALTFWEDSNDGVVAHVKTIFTHICSLHNKAKTRGVSEALHRKFTDHLISCVARLRWIQKSKFYGLQALLEFFGATRLIAVFPTVLPELVTSFRDVTVRNPGAHLLGQFVTLLKKEMTETESNANLASEKCLAILLPPIIELLLADDASMRDAMTTYALQPLMQAFPTSCSKGATALLLAKLRGEADGRMRDSICWAIMAVAKVARELAQLEGINLHSYIEDPAFSMEKLLEAAILHNDEELRCMALDVVCASAKLTEEPSPLELHIMELFICSGLKSAASSFRQRCVVKVRRFLNRLKESVRRHHGKSTDRTAMQRVCKIVSFYAERLVAAFYPGGPFQRKVIPMELYSTLLDVWGPHATEGTPPSSFLTSEQLSSLGLVSSEHAEMVLDCLWDAFDRPRQLGFELLTKFPLPLPCATTPESVATLLNYAVKLITSPRARETDCGAILVRFVFRTYINKLKWRVQLHPAVVVQAPASTTPPKDDEEDPCLSFISGLVALLDSHIAAATLNLAQASQRTPMHGIVLTLRYVIEEATLRGDGAPAKGSRVWEGWRNFISGLTDRVKAVMALALKVVGDIAPEGFKSSQRPSYHEEELMVGGQEDEESSDLWTGNKGQILLVCAWVSVKESSMLIGTLLSRIDLPNGVAPDKDFFISVDHIRSYGDALLQLLLSTMHNGAVEGAHVGFQSLCVLMLQASNPALFGLPRMWLNNLLHRIEHETLIITRRSSGLPPAIASILKAEGLRSGPLLPVAFKELLRIANSPTTVTFRPAVHSLHVLCYLSRTMSAEAATYFADAFMLAIRGYTSESWPVRNSSTMLFSALIERMTAKRTAEQSATTVESFFARFPSLYEFLLAHLRRATSSEERTLYSALYPILVLFSRFLPIADSRGGGPKNEGMRLRVEDLIAPVASCHTQSNFKIRDMAARALAPLIALPAVAPFLISLLESLPTDLNAIHGRMAQLRYLAAAACKYSTVIEDIYARVVPLLTTSLPLLHRLEPPAALMFFEACVSIATATTATSTIVEQRGFRQRLLSSATSLLLQGPMEGKFMAPVYRKSLARFAVACALSSDAPPGSQGSVTAFVLRLVSDADYEVRKRTLKVMRNHESLASCVDVPTLRQGLLARLKQEQHVWCLSLTLEVLHHLPAASFDAASGIWEQLQHIASTHSATAGLAALELMGHCLNAWCTASSSPLVAAWSMHFIARVHEHSLSSQPVNCRLAAINALVLSNIPHLAVSNPQLNEHLVEPVISSWLALCLLLEDDDEVVRREAAEYSCMLQTRVAGQKPLSSTLSVSRAVEFCFGYLATRFSTTDVLFNHFVLLAEKRVKPPIFEQEFDPSGDLFEREGDNFWREELFVAQVVGRTFKTIIASRANRLSEPQRSRLVALEQQCLQALRKADEWLRQALQGKWQHKISCNLAHQPEVFEAIACVLSLLPSLALIDSPKQVKDDIHELLVSFNKTHYHPLLQQSIFAAAIAYKNDTLLRPAFARLSANYLMHE